MSSRKKLEIGIVGGGIAGMYCAWKLASKGHDVVLYERLGRLGGRIETISLSNFDAEVGPMRFELDIQTELSELAHSLGIEFAPFTPPKSDPAEFPKYHLLPNERSTREKQAIADAAYVTSPGHYGETAFSHYTEALDLLRYGVYRVFNKNSENLELTLPEVVDKPPVLGDRRRSLIESYADDFDDDGYDHLRTNYFFGDQVNSRQPLHHIGFWNVLATVLSPGALSKVRDTGTFYHLIPENPCASEWLIFWLRLFRSKADLSTIKVPGGVYEVVARLEQRLGMFQNSNSAANSGRVRILRRATVDAVNTSSELSNKVRVTAIINGKQDARDFHHVILALPPAPLKKLLAKFPLDVVDYIDGAEQFPLLKICVTIKDPWWEELPKAQEGAHLVPTREVHYFNKPASGPTDRAMIMLYMDRPALNYWKQYVDSTHLQAQINEPAGLKHELARHIALLFPGNERDNRQKLEANIIEFAIRDWSREPFEAAFHVWKQRINVPEALDRLAAFELTTATALKNVHICGEAYSNYQAFVEGALRSAKNVVDAILSSNS